MCGGEDRILLPLLCLGQDKNAFCLSVSVSYSLGLPANLKEIPEIEIDIWTNNH